MEAPPVTYVLTGFGPFRGNSPNPTEVLIERLSSLLPFNELYSVSSLSVVEVAAVAAIHALLSLHGEMEIPLFDKHFSAVCDIPSMLRASLPPSQRPGFLLHQVRDLNRGRGARHCVFLHLGLNSDSKCFALETRAYNMAEFGDGDERGFVVSAHPVIAGRTLNVAMTSALARTPARGGSRACTVVPLLTPASASAAPPSLLAVVRDNLRRLGHNVQLSFDPGRFLCNFIYLNSMHLAEQANCTSAVLAWHQLRKRTHQLGARPANPASAGFAAAPALATPTAGDSMASRSRAFTEPHITFSLVPEHPFSRLPAHVEHHPPQQPQGYAAEGCTSSNVNTTYAAAAQPPVGMRRCWSLFVHVPPFSVIPLERQLSFLLSLLDTLAVTLAPLPAVAPMLPTRAPVAIASAPAAAPAAEGCPMPAPLPAEQHGLAAVAALASPRRPGAAAMARGEK